MSTQPGETTKQIQLIQLENQSRIITMAEKLGTLVIVAAAALVALKLGVVNDAMLNVILGYLGLRTGETVVRGPLASMAGRLFGGGK